MKNIIEIKEDYAILKVNRKDITLDVIIDIDDIEKISIGSWHAIYDKTLQTPNYYIAHRYNSKIKGKGVIKLHRLIMDCPKGLEVDHINHNTLDNRKSNLRICTRFENQQNLRSKSSSHTGVFFRARDNKWYANITINKVRKTRVFKTENEAIKWRKEMEVMPQCLNK